MILGIIALVAPVGCSGEKPPEPPADSSSVGEGTDESELAEQAPAIELDADFLASNSVPGDVADVLSFNAGGDDPCHIDGPPSLDAVTETPGYTTQPVAQVGWGAAVCISDLGEADVQITDPNGETTKLRASHVVEIGGPIGTPVGLYEISVTIDGTLYEGQIEMINARRPRLYGTGGPVTMGNFVPGIPGQDVQLGLVGFDADAEVLLAFYENQPFLPDGRSGIGVSELFTSVSVRTDALGQAEINLPTSSSDEGRCFHVVANPNEAVREAHTSMSDSGIATLSFSNALDVEVCLYS